MTVYRGYVFAALLVVSGCATGPSLEKMQANVPQATADRGRIFLYRTNSPFGAAVQPSVMLDNVEVGDAIPGGVFICDVAPGPHVISVTTEVEKVANLDIAAGEVTYVKMDAGFGWLVGRIHLELVAAETGAAEAAKASLMQSRCPMG